jgi:hypothetical protein
VVDGGGGGGGGDILITLYIRAEEVENKPKQQNLEMENLPSRKGHAEYPSNPMSFNSVQRPKEFQLDQQYILRTNWLITQHILDVGQFDVLHLHCILPLLRKVVQVQIW